MNKIYFLYTRLVKAADFLEFCAVIEMRKITAKSQLIQLGVNALKNILAQNSLPMVVFFPTFLTQVNIIVDGDYSLN